MAKILGKTHKSKVLGADTHSVSLRLPICSRFSSFCGNPGYAPSGGLQSARLALVYSYCLRQRLVSR